MIKHWENEAGSLFPNGWEALSAFIILQAVEDYRAALKKHRKYPKCRNPMKTLEEVGQFFSSPWFACLTDLNPQTLQERLLEENSDDDQKISGTGKSAVREDQ